MIDQIGIIGAGRLAGYLIEGLRKASPDLRILLSDQAAQKSERLASRWGAQAVAGNQALADAEELIVLAMGSEKTLAACQAIAFRPGQVMASTAAKLSLATLEAAVTPARAVRVMLVSSSALSRSPTLVFPYHPDVYALFAVLGRVHPFPDEASFVSASLVAACYAWMCALGVDPVAWDSRTGVLPSAARSPVLETIRRTAEVIPAHPDRLVADLLHEWADSDGAAGEGLASPRRRASLPTWTEALDEGLAELPSCQP
ncbi:MAG: NAD(P)-binding domain-containing protein [Holophaga sp.]|jgi:pyrroline-5-carboxylate reductase